MMIALVFATALGGCAIRPGPELLEPVTALPDGSQSVEVFAVTDRRAMIGEAQPVYGSERGINAYEMLTIGVAPPSKTTEIADLSKLNRDFVNDFVTLKRQQLSRQAFSQTVTATARANDKAIVVFVHGYNQSYQEALLRMAQLSVDSRISAVPIVFSWPSQANLAGYVADRDSVAYARDDLVDLLTLLVRTHSDHEFLVLGHSMGAFLVMEAVRQLRLEGEDKTIRSLQIALAAPDIDIDVFKKQMSVIGELSSPLTVLTSPDDHALQISASLVEDRTRLGAVDVSDPETEALARQTGTRIFDIATLPAADGFNHDRFIYLAGLYGSVSESDELFQRLQNAGTYILDASGTILTAPQYVLTGVR